jgi:hypothetical protein
MKDVAGYDTKRLFIGSQNPSGPSPLALSKSSFDLIPREGTYWNF